MPLSILDALLLTLLLSGIFYVIAGDIAAAIGSDDKEQDRSVTGWAQWLRAHKFREMPGPQVAPGVATPSQRRLPAPPALPHAADLLVVDDSAVARAKLRRLFVDNGYGVHLAKDGVEALDLLQKGRYSLMITDLEMPNMDGISLIHECLKRPPTSRMPIIAVSAHENLRAKFNECRDVCGVHRKPWADDILLSHVATLISVRGGAPTREGRRVSVTA